MRVALSLALLCAVVQSSPVVKIIVGDSGSVSKIYLKILKNFIRNNLDWISNGLEESFISSYVKI